MGKVGYKKSRANLMTLLLIFIGEVLNPVKID